MRHSAVSHLSKSNGKVSVAQKSFECKDGGVVCGARITAATEEQVLVQAIEHAKKAHGVDLTTSKTLARYAQSLIRDA